ncbi:MAG: dTMP kinase [Thermodesulfobacteriota bacterium]|nr:dTMP kinase [Thermodesulfobacteriota bacterium]
MFISFEGIEGCGKTTQIKRLVKKIEGFGIPLITTLEPGGTMIGETIRHILLNSHNKKLSPLTELILYSADRAQHIEEVIKPALNQKKWVICDRFFDSTVAYQGAARGQDMKLIRALNDEVTQGIRPDITFLLDCSVDIGLHRALRRNKAVFQEDQDRFEREKMDFHMKVRRSYLELAHQEPKRFVIIDATLHKAEVEKNIFQHIKPFLF